MRMEESELKKNLLNETLGVGKNIFRSKPRLVDDVTRDARSTGVTN
jgi:hypothetical protein